MYSVPASGLIVSGNVGIGTSSPNAKLHVYGAGTTTDYYANGDAVGPTLYLQDSGTASYNGGQILFGSAFGVHAGIKGAVTNGTGPAGVLVFQTRTTSGNVVDRMQVTSTGGLALGTTSDPGAGAMYATGNITAYYSDDRLKTKLGKIENALDKICTLEGFYYEANETAQALGYKPVREVGISAQATQKVLPEIVAPAPISDEYLTIRYERLAPLLIEAIKELREEIKALK